MKSIVYSFSVFLLFLTVIPFMSQAQDDNEVFTVVEDAPEYPGGAKARVDFIKNNLEYPESARKNNVEGTVYITFVIDTDGSVTEVELLRGIEENCNKAALEVVKSMPKWIPGKQRGEPVKVQFNMPIRFKLEDKRKEKKESKESKEKH
ncbi:MAG: energy transducer TonB [Bacteroidota bacterium]